MKWTEKVSGIYTITNIMNNKIYVGYSKNVYYRLAKHKNLLKEKTHKNKHLQAAWNKYGEPSFKLELLEECPIDLLPSQEHYWCNLLNVNNREFGYNDRPTNPNDKAGMSEEHKKNLSKSKKGKFSKKSIQSMHEANKKRVLELTRDLKLIKWNSIGEASLFHKIKPVALSRIIQKQNNLRKGKQNKHITSKFCFMN